MPSDADGDADDRGDERERGGESDPSMTSRTTAAMTTPTISPSPRICGTVWAMSCEG